MADGTPCTRSIPAPSTTTSLASTTFNTCLGHHGSRLLKLSRKYTEHRSTSSLLSVVAPPHGSLEGVGGVITSEVCHLKADISVIPEMQLF